MQTALLSRLVRLVCLCAVAHGLTGPQDEEQDTVARTSETTPTELFTKLFLTKNEIWQMRHNPHICAKRRRRPPHKQSGSAVENTVVQTIDHRGLGEEKNQKNYLYSVLNAKWHFTCPVSRAGTKEFEWMMEWTASRDKLEPVIFTGVTAFGALNWNRDEYPDTYESKYLGFVCFDHYFEGIACTLWFEGSFLGELYPHELTMRTITDGEVEALKPILKETCRIAPVPGYPPQPAVERDCEIHRIDVTVASRYPPGK